PAHGADSDVNPVPIAFIAVTPNISKEIGAGDRLAFSLHQIPKQRKLEARQPEPHAIDHDLACLQVKKIVLRDPELTRRDMREPFVDRSGSEVEHHGIQPALIELDVS